jgi:hypothetical protein
VDKKPSSDEEMNVIGCCNGALVAPCVVDKEPSSDEEMRAENAEKSVRDSTVTSNVGRVGEFGGYDSFFEGFNPPYNPISCEISL